MYKLKYSFTILLFTLTSLFSYGVNNSHILQTDPFFSHHVLLVEKSTHRLFLYENQDNQAQLIKTYHVATGKRRGNKLVQGDNKTPEGIYFVKNFYSQNYLQNKYGEYGKIYGVGAFPLNYPNPIDSLHKKTGHGIWLHSTDNDKRVDKRLDSRGCVVLKKADIKEVSQYLDLQNNTPIIIVENINFHNPLTIKKSKKRLSTFLDSWLNSWRHQNFYKYISHYDPELYRDRVRTSFKDFKRYKKHIFSKQSKPSIFLSNYSTFIHKDYAVVQMLQHYKSNKIKDVGKKILYLKKDHRYRWKIIAEYWEKINPNLKKFIPQQRFFK